MMDGTGETSKLLWDNLSEREVLLNRNQTRFITSQKAFTYFTLKHQYVRANARKLEGGKPSLVCRTLLILTRAKLLVE